jgi:hypothetical protein
MSHVELYEALKESIPDKAARLIAEAFPAARDVATKPSSIRNLPSSI